MANSTTAQIILDGPRNVVVKFEGVLDTSDLTSTTVVDPALLIGTDNTGTALAANLQITRITHNVQDGITLNLFWDANTPLRIEDLAGRGNPKYNHFGGLINNAGAGKTGKIKATTTGWSGIKSFSCIIEMVKTA